MLDQKLIEFRIEEWKEAVMKIVKKECTRFSQIEIKIRLQIKK